jgi:hypothetical protein
MTSISRRSIRRLVLTTTVAALAVAVGPLASPAAARYTTLVVPGQSIGGVKLSQNRDKVRKSKPLGLKKPTQHTAISDSYTDKAGEQLIVLYKAGKKKQVLGISSGLGTWHTANGLVNGASPAQAASLLPGCSFYGGSSSGRDPKPDPGDGQHCELVLQPPLRYFYLSFNTGDPTAQLAAFALSRVLIP